MNVNKIDEILNKSKKNQFLTKEEIIVLLSIEDAADLKKLYKAARDIRNNISGNKIFLYGFIYFSNYCRNDCNFCYSRISNNIKRYRKNSQEIIDTAVNLKKSGVNLIDLTMGEDQKFYEDEFSDLIEIIKLIKTTTNLPVMISPGISSEEIIEKFNKYKVDWFALYQETHNINLFNKLRKNQNYDERMNRKKFAKELGLLIEEGILVGVGETVEDIASSILKMGEIGASQMRVMSFIPQKGSPMEKFKSPDRKLEYKIISVLRILYKNVLIPASLDIDGIKGLKDRINSGANLITSIIPSKKGFVGVAQHDKDIDDDNRSVEKISKILEEMSLKCATTSDYENYIKKLRS